MSSSEFALMGDDDGISNLPFQLSSNNLLTAFIVAEGEVEPVSSEWCHPPPNEGVGATLHQKGRTRRFYFDQEAVCDFSVPSE